MPEDKPGERQSMPIVLGADNQISSTATIASDLAAAPGEKTGPLMLTEIVGQDETARRLTALVEIARRRGGVFDHCLLVGPDGCGKRTIALTVVRELGVNLREVEASTIEMVGDAAAIINDFDKGDVLLVLNINRMSKSIADLFASLMS